MKEKWGFVNANNSNEENLKHKKSFEKIFKIYLIKIQSYVHQKHATTSHLILHRLFYLLSK